MKSQITYPGGNLLASHCYDNNNVIRIKHAYLYFVTFTSLCMHAHRELLSQVVFNDIYIYIIIMYISVYNT